MNETKETSDREITLTRFIDAPRSRVWEALSELKQREAWWGPDGFTNETKSCEWKVGGHWIYTMKGPDGKLYPNNIRFTEIVENERLAYVHGEDETEGPSCHEGLWTLEEENGKTRLTMRLVLSSPEERALLIEKFGVLEGGKQTLAKLAAHASTPPAHELRFERIVKAPRSRVWDAWTDPEQMKHWFAPKPFTLVVKSFDLRPGGRFEMAMRPPQGDDFPFSGTYREIAAPERLLWNSEFSDASTDQMTTEVLFDDLGDATRLRIRQTFHFLSPIAEQGIKGAQQGWTMTLDQLAAFVLERRSST